MATSPGSTARAFNGLTGAEIRTRILQEVEARLADDTRFKAHLVFPVVTWSWTLEVETYPAPGILGPGGDGIVKVEVKGRVAVEGGPALEAPRRESALLDAHVRPFRDAPALGVGDAPADRGSGPASALPAAVEARFVQLETLIQRLAGPVVPVEPAPAATHHPDVTMRTATGLPITGGARPSPGAGLADSFGSGSAIGSVQTEEPVRVAYGVKHPPLDEGGVGAPDAVRRAGGMPIPQMQSTPGGIVDLPGGSF